MELPDAMDMLSLPSVLIVDDDRTSRTVLVDLLHGECRVLLEQAGAMLYQAKHQGRNRVVSSAFASTSRF